MKRLVVVLGLLTLSVDFARAQSDMLEREVGSAGSSAEDSGLFLLCIREQVSKNKIVHCSTVLETTQSPDVRARAHFFRGLGYFHSREYDHAIIDFTQAIDINPQKAQMPNYFFRGHAFLATGDKDRAIANYRQALAIHPTDERVLKKLKDLGVKP